MARLSNRRLWVLPLCTVLLFTALMGAGGCREESPAMKKANLGRAFSERGDHPRAIATLKEAIAMDPELVMGYEHLAMAYEAAGMYPEAIQYYRETIKREPTRDFSHAALGCLLLSTGGATAEAEKALSDAIALNQTDSRALGCMGAVYLDRRDYPAAIEASSKAVRYNPQNVQAHLNLGIAYAESGRTEEGKASIRQAIALSGDDPAFAERANMYLQALEHPAVSDGPAGTGGGHG